MSFMIAALFVALSLFLLPVTLGFVIFTPMGWSVSALVTVILIFYIGYKMYKW